MLSLPGQFTFTADRPQLHCAAFLIGEPEEFVTIHYDLVSIDCQGGDFLKVRLPRGARSRRGAPRGVSTGRRARRGATARGAGWWPSGRGAPPPPGRPRGANPARSSGRGCLTSPPCAPGTRAPPKT